MLRRHLFLVPPFKRVGVGGEGEDSGGYYGVPFFTVGEVGTFVEVGYGCDVIRLGGTGDDGFGHRVSAGVDGSSEMLGGERGGGGEEGGGGRGGRGEEEEEGQTGEGEEEGAGVTPEDQNEAPGCGVHGIGGGGI